MKSGNVKEIANNYNNFLESIINMQNRASLSYLVEDKMVQANLRESYLKSIIDNEHENDTRNKKKI